MKKNFILLGTIFLLIMLTTISFALATLRIEYKYDEEKNQVIASIISDTELKDTKPTWKLSEDRKTYTKVFSENMIYTTPVEDKFGNIIEAKVEITDVKSANIKMEYKYDENTNQVTAQIISDMELKDTKPTWKLSADKKTYTKVFSENMNYTTPVIDKLGNIIEAKIEITEVRSANIKMAYKYDEKNNKVIAQIISDIELKNTKPTWKLSADKKIYEKEYLENMTYSTLVEDKYGNQKNIDIIINQIDNIPPKIDIEYKYNDDDTVTIYLKSNEKLGDTKPTWKLSADKLIYEKTYATDEDYSTLVQDIYGNSTNVPVKLKKKKEEYNEQDGSKISVRYIYTAYDNVIVQIVSSEELENTKPTWKLSEDRHTYTKIYDRDEDYTTTIQYVNGTQRIINIKIDYFLKVNCETGTYGKSGAKLKGINSGSDLEYLRFGNGENVLFATFCVHGFEDSWDRDGTILVETANNFYNRLVSDMDKDIAKKWTIYIFKEVNPDGRRMGYTSEGPGRTTLYSKTEKGIDINRSWQTGNEYKTYTDSRNYNGTTGFQAYEAEYLRDFLLSHKSKNGKTVLVDLHGWEDQLIGDEEVCKYYKQKYTSCRTTGYGRYGTQYLITWARQNLGAKVSLVELPLAKNITEARNMKLSEKYIEATLNMLKGL